MVHSSSKEEPFYQKLNKEDVASLRELNEVFAEAFADAETHLSKRPSQEYLQKLLSQQHVVFLVARTQQKIVGGLVAYVLEKYEQERSEIYIYDLAVAAQFRRRGIARELIRQLQAYASSIGAWVIFVQADRVDAPAVALYRSLGMQEEPLHFDIPITK